ETDVMSVEQLLRGPQRGVIDTQWRAAVAADITGRSQAGGAIAPRLIKRQAHEGLVRGDENPSALLSVLVVEGDRGLRHRRGGSPSRRKSQWAAVCWSSITLPSGSRP